jgi:uncharacterized protein YdcH (DUF465 family)
MFTSPDQFAAATKTLFELQMNTFNALTSKAVEGVEQVVALNMSTAKNAMQNPAGASDPKAMMEAVGAYGEDLRELIEQIHKEFSDAADHHLAEAKNTLSALIYDVTKNVKPGSENAVEIVKTAIDNAFKGYEQVARATRQAKQQVDEQVAKATESVNKARKK